MGVSGCGKSTVGVRLAQLLGWEFHDGDDFHPPANKIKQGAGIPLDDHDRRPWLGAIRAFMEEAHSQGRHLVIPCSALRERYRDWLGRGLPWVQFVHLQGDKELIRERLKARTGHFMSPTLLDNQYATLEAPLDALTVDVGPPPESIASEIILRLRLRPLAVPKASRPSRS